MTEAAAAGDVALRTVVPIFLLVGAGAAGRAAGVLREGDARVLNAYLYWFALPALFVADLSGMRFDAANARFVAAGVLPLAVALAAIGLVVSLLRLGRGPFVLLSVSTVFGSLAFFGIPFVVFAFPGRDAERLATLAAAGISIAAVSLTIGLLEFFRLEAPSVAAALVTVGGRLARNPLIVSIAAGTALSVTGLRLPEPVERPLHMLGTTTATVSFFMLGAFLYGRRYTNLVAAAGLALLRLAVLPAVALAAARMAGIGGMERTTLVLMSGMPAAVSLIVFAERYRFYPETIASLILISSLGGALTLNAWAAFLAR